MNINQKKYHKIIVVTPAGRKRYLDIMSKYIFKNNSIDEWDLWDNCRGQSHASYFNQ